MLPTIVPHYVNDKEIFNSSVSFEEEKLMKKSDRIMTLAELWTLLYSKETWAIWIGKKEGLKLPKKILK